MRRLFFFLFLIPGLAMGQGADPGTASSSSSYAPDGGPFATSALTAGSIDAGVFVGTLVVAPLTGNVTGNVTGNLTGNVTGNTAGFVTASGIDAGVIVGTLLVAPVTGNVTGNLTGNVTGNVTGTQTGTFETIGGIDAGFIQATSVLSSAATGTIGYRLETGARLVMNGSTASHYLYDDGTNVALSGLAGYVNGNGQGVTFSGNSTFFTANAGGTTWFRDVSSNNWLAANNSTITFYKGLRNSGNGGADIGAANLGWDYAWVGGIKDGNSVLREWWGGDTNTQYMGQAADSAGNTAHIYGSKSMTAGVDRDLSRWCNGAFTCTTSTSKARVTTDGTYITGSDQLKVPAVHGSGTVAQAMESGSGAMTAGALAVTFGTAFGAAPKCICIHVNATPVACGLASAPSTTTATFNVTGGTTDTVHWFCMGQR